eukprot:TRINITY_DN1349_c0_g4_i1.p1 TRINITY_DN1349_c0_g4~~TRINITY_DN1349_c0_g4_i1.p1  ORF type:complete len:333 (-),score=95.04 TRINITY_DN1349_c0_g4_i1:121-1119(-)
MGDFARRIQSFDLYRHLPKDATEQTFSGGITTIVCAILVAFLFFSEFAAFLRVETTSSMFVDTPADSHVESKLRINMDITMIGLPCAVLSVDVQDVMGTHVMDVHGDLFKYRMDAQGNMRVDSQGKPLFTPDHATYDEAKGQIGEGCRVKGHVWVKKVPGNFHISAHAHTELLSLLFSEGRSMNVSHHIDFLSFGDVFEVEGAKHALYPLNGVQQIAPPHPDGPHVTTTYEYYIKVVPTMYEKLDGSLFNAYQFTVNTNSITGQYQLPAVYFRWDMSPITVKFQQTRMAFAHFLVQICAIIGGVFTVLGVVNSFVHSSIERLMKKSQLGKLG